ncbi:MAG: hypothetical protein M3Q71_15570 [Chloroflexota bacterium]|nr:hypothetical protein [Chloroflexota bacterium]MDP9472060.1 hypothetical protein [Chloroflexota bacterium]
MNQDFTELRVHEVLVDGQGAVTALRVEATWGTHQPNGEPLIWDRSIFTVAATGPLAEAETGDRLELRPVGATT